MYQMTRRIGPRADVTRTDGSASQGLGDAEWVEPSRPTLGGPDQNRTFARAAAALAVPMMAASV